MRKIEDCRMTQSGANPSLAILAVLAGKRGVLELL
jgi:hypothetical protein